VRHRAQIGAVVSNLPLRALYSLKQIAKACALDPRTMKVVLDEAGVRFLKSGRSWWVPLSELELKVPPLWESIKAAEMLRHLVEEP